MTIQSAKAFLLRCLVVNFAFLLAWSLATYAAHDTIHGLSSRFFPVPVAAFDAVDFAGRPAYKLAVPLFNVAPLLALASATRPLE